MKRNIARYSAILVATALLLLASVAGFNALVDPYGMYRLVEGEGFNLNKPAIYHRVRLLKAYEVRRRKPESIVLGTSRVHLGISPRHDGWSSRYERRYNLAFDGATTKEMYLYLLHANADGRLKHVMLGLDTYHLAAVPGSHRPDFDPALLRNEPGWLNGPRMLAADLKLLTALGTLQESIRTLDAQDHAEPVWLATDGQRLGEVFFRRPGEHFMTCGPRCYFDEIDKLEVRFKLEWRIPASPGRILNAGPPQAPDPVTSLGYIEKIIAYCRAHDIDLAIFLTPSHAHQLELDALTDNWWSVENGRRAIVDLVASDHGRHSGKPPVPLYDFGGYSPVTTERLPPAGSRAELRYYWDSSHFKEAVGNWVLDRLLGTAPADGELPPQGFGVSLGPDNIDDAIAQLRQGQAEYRRQNADELEKLAGWVADFKTRHGIE